MAVKLRQRELGELNKIRVWHSNPDTVELRCDDHMHWFLRVNGVDLPSIVDKALGHIRDAHVDELGRDRK